MTLSPDNNHVFFLIPARSQAGVKEKIEEVGRIGAPYVVVCGERGSMSNVIYRERSGKFDAINYGATFIGDDVKVVCLNDVDTKIFHIEKALELFEGDKDVALVFCKVVVKAGPQVYFYSILDRIRKKLSVASSGELMLIRKEIFDKLLPLPPCKTEDNYISFKLLELGYKVIFCEECWVETERTKTLADEMAYKMRSVTGIYQALSYTKPPFLVRIFYAFLPFLTPLLLIQGKRGVFWMKGIIKGLSGFLVGDRGGRF